jgi:large subunit ribosomal protein L31
MKKGIHPKYYPEAKVVCSCGNTFTTGSTQELIRTDVCSACHPFFTGEQRIVDAAGQVERFMKRLEKREELAVEEKARLEEVADKKVEASKKKPDDAEAAKAIAEKLRGKKATAEKSPKEASGKPAGKAAEATAAKKPKRKRAAKKESAASEESGKAAD